MAKVIDVHTTFYPKAWIDYLETRTESPRVKRTGATSFIFYVEDTPTSHVDKPGHYDVAARIRDMDAAGINTQILGLSIPSVEVIEAHEGIAWAKRINDYFAELCQKYPGRFYFNATLPYQDVDAAVKELERAYKDLGAKGILLFSNLNGKCVASPEFYPVYSMAEKYGLPVFLHPASPLTREIMRQHKLSVALYGYIFDTTIAMMSLIWQGVLEKFPKLIFVHSHLGGVVPYSVGRVETCWSSFSEEMGLKLPKSPSEYYKSQVYVDTISYFVPAMKCCLEFMGADHICLGTDYAHRIGNLEEAIDWVKKFGLSEKDTNKILGGNAARLYKLDRK